MQIKCPICKKSVEYKDNEFRPFCSERCKLLDLGAWVDGEYSLPSETTSLNEEEMALLEKAMQEKEE